MHGEIRQLLRTPLNPDFFGFLFALFPNPFMMLIGIALLLSRLNSYRLARELSWPNIFLFACLMYLFHPFLLIFFVLCFSIQLKILKTRGLGLIKPSTLNFGFALVASLCCSYLIYFWSTFGKKLMGTFQIVTPINFDKFELVFYISLPFILLVASLFLINISLYELMVKFYPIFIMFFMELMLVVLSLVLSRNLLLFWEFNGISAIAHVLYYVPSIYVLLSLNRRQRIKWMSFDRLGANSESLMSILILKASTFLYFVVISISAFNNFHFLQNVQECTTARQVEDIYIQAYNETNSSSFSINELRQVREEVLSEVGFSRFMQTPEPLSLNSVREIACNIDGLGYLIVNGFTFDSLAKDKSNAILRNTEELVNE
jgi:hypothetical protein